MRIVLFVATAASLGHCVAALMHDLREMPFRASRIAQGSERVGQTQTPLEVVVSQRQELKNFYDLSYTFTLSLGGQTLEAILDSGSFDLLVLSTDCERCGTSRSHLYDGNKSNQYVAGHTRATCTYGSGQAYTEESYDNISVGDLQASQQLFWMVYDVDKQLSGLMKEDSFDAIFGLGSTKTALAFAKSELESVRRQVDEYTSFGGVMDPSITQIVDGMEAKVELTTKYDTTTDNLNILDTSVCFGKESRSPGFVVWNDLSSKMHPELFVEVPVVGDYYWSAVLTDVRIGDARDHINDSFQESMGRTPALGCTMQPCSAIIDTGTSVIVAPSATASAVERVLNTWEQEGGGDCDDLSLLPNLEFSIDGNKFILPPESYVANFVGSDVELLDVQRLLPHLFSKHIAQTANASKPASQSYSYCSSAISPLDASSQFGPLWILGAPFFREYYTTFHGSHGSATSMSFSKANADCLPGANPALQFEQMEAKLPTKRKAQLHLDVSKIRTSSVLNKHRLLTSSKLPMSADLGAELFEPHRHSVVVRI